MKQTESVRICPILHQIRIHDGKERIRTAMEHNPINVAQDFERSSLECGLTNTFTERVGVVPVCTVLWWVTTFKFVDDECGEETRGMLATP